MARARSTDTELTGRAAELFRSQGIAATSMSELAAQLGIEKASLYYRFPGGKDQMVLAAAASVDAWFAEHVLGSLHGQATPAQRIARCLRALRVFYADGTKPCILDTLSLPAGNKALAAALQRSLQGWLSAFAVLARESGLRPALAARRAEQAVIQVEGSLILARVLGNSRPFRRALAALPALLLAESMQGPRFR